MDASNISTCPAGHEYARGSFAECPQCTLVDVASPDGTPLYKVCLKCSMIYDPEFQQEEECPRCNYDHADDLECERCGDYYMARSSDTGRWCGSCESHAERRFEESKYPDE